jgi:hypothetical protein
MQFAMVNLCLGFLMLFIRTPVACTQPLSDDRVMGFVDIVYVNSEGDSHLGYFPFAKLTSESRTSSSDTHGTCRTRSYGPHTVALTTTMET